MKILSLSAVCVLSLTLTGCSLLSSAGSLLNGMVQAVGRTLADAEKPAAAPGADPAGVEQRGAAIAARGMYAGGRAPASTVVTDNVARR